MRFIKLFESISNKEDIFYACSDFLDITEYNDYNISIFEKYCIIIVHQYDVVNIGSRIIKMLSKIESTGSIDRMLEIGYTFRELVAYRDHITEVTTSETPFGRYTIEGDNLYTIYQISYNKIEKYKGLNWMGINSRFPYVIESASYMLVFTKNL